MGFLHKHNTFALTVPARPLYNAQIGRSSLFYTQVSTIPAHFRNNYVLQKTNCSQNSYIEGMIKYSSANSTYYQQNPAFFHHQIRKSNFEWF